MSNRKSITEELFHQCALAAYVEEAGACGGWPEPEAVRRRAYRLYEEELARKNGKPQPGRVSAPPVAEGE